MQASGQNQRVHFIGIGGSGLSAIALVLLESRIAVSGSDRQLSPQGRALQVLGAAVVEGHQAENIRGASLVVRSSAIPDDNVEVQAARQAGIPVLKRSEFLLTWFADQILKGRPLLAVAGTHGKTTTTAMLSWTLTALGQDPGFIIGGTSVNLGVNAHGGQGPYFVIEADEYDRMFLGLNPAIAIVTNIEHDHPDCYPTPEDFYQAFFDFAGHLKPGGTLLGCGDDPGAARLLAECSARNQQVLAYGLDQPGYACQVRHLAHNQHGGFDFEASYRFGAEVEPEVVAVSLQVPGVHNVRNALGVLSVIRLLGLSLKEAAAALRAFQGTGRRFEVLGQAGGVILVDDYGHHPTEIRATLAAARARYPRRTIWAVWQPHTYSRLRALLPEFCSAFNEADHVLVTDVYAARELPPTDGFSAKLAAARLEHPAVSYTPALVNARDELLARVQPGDIVLVFSAGDANQITQEVFTALLGQDNR